MVKSIIELTKQGGPDMRLIRLQLLCCFLLLMVTSCATIRTPIPVGCGQSYIYANKGVLDVVMSVVVQGVHALVIVNPTYYQRAHESAQVAAALLRQQPISLSKLTDSQIVNILSPLFGLIPIDAILDQCDRDYLADYLLMM